MGRRVSGRQGLVRHENESLYTGIPQRLLVLWGELELEYPIQDKDHYDELIEEIYYRRSINISQEGLLRTGETPFKQICREVVEFTFLPLPGYSTTPTPTPRLDEERERTLSVLTNLGPPRPHLQHQASLLSPNSKIILIEPLTPTPTNPNIEIKSQVWKATIQGIEVIIKIYFSCFHYPWWSKSMKKCMDFFPEEEQAHREAWAYNLLTNLQGTRIPRSYGFYEVSELEFRELILHSYRYL